MDNGKERIAETINRMSGKYSPEEVFTDWVKCMALAIQNACCMIHDAVWQDREKQYLSTIKKYGSTERKELTVMMKMLTDVMEQGIEDVLGSIYMELDMGNRRTGQFFTPFHLSVLAARLALKGQKGEKISLSEPSVGSGGMVIAAAKILAEQGKDYQKCMKVTAQDIDWRAVYMSYVQFSMFGIDAQIAQGDTLAEPYTGGRYDGVRVFRTPNRMGVLL